MRESSFVGVAENRIDRASARRRGPGRVGRAGSNPERGDPMRRASQAQRPAILSRSSRPLEAGERDDGLDAARGGMIAALLGLIAWALILFPLRRLLSQVF